MTLVQKDIIRRVDDLTALELLIPRAHEGRKEHYQLAFAFSVPDWQGLFVQFWQLECKAFAELEQKLSEVGGVMGQEFKISETSFPSSQGDSILKDKTLLLSCINQKYQILPAYEAVRRRPMSFDVKKMVQRHHMQGLYILEQLERIFPVLAAPVDLPTIPLPG